MSHLTAPTIDPQTRFALAVLRRHLTDEGTFSPKAIGDIIADVRAKGFIDEFTPYVRPDEVDSLTAAYIAGFPAVPFDDPAWGPAIPAIAGGIGAPPFEPSPEDWAEYRQVFDELDQVVTPPHTQSNYLSPTTLINIRRTLWGV